MSSPSSSSAAGAKRKRTTNLPDPVAQASESRDASGEDTTAPESASVAAHHRKTDGAASASHPPSKRQRAGNGSDRPAAYAADHEMSGGGEPSDTTEASTDIAERVGRSRTRKGDKIDAVNEEAESMETPPTGRLTHPVGYRTNDPPTGRPIRVYADGVFDLFHLGHMRQLEQAKKAFPDVYLIVGVTGDEDTHMRKGLTVLSGKERAETVRHCKWVDQVVESCPWIVTPDFLEEHKIDYVAHDDIPYGADEGDDIYAPIKKEGKFLVTQRTEGVSTTGIITKIVRDYEKYISRQLKRGTSRQELNVSWLKKNELDMKRHVQEMRDNIKANWSTTGQELSRELRQFWPVSRPASPAPTSRGAILGLPEDAIARGSSLSLNAPSSPLGHLVLPKSPGGVSERQQNDFVAGYALGLIGGVRSWMTKSRRNLDSRAPSDDDSEEGEDQRRVGRT